MKKNIILSVLFAGFLSVSCNSFLDTLPDNRTEINSEEKITALLVSAYPKSTDRIITEMASDNAMDNGSQYTIEDIVQSESYLWKDITSAGSDSPKSYWEACYSAIAAANLALESIEELGNPESLNAQKGEALICRAYAHFALANLFCLPYNPTTAGTDMGIPYSMKSETTLDPTYKRGTMAELYSKINADIEEGLPLISDRIYSIPKYHFNVKAANAFAARFNLYYHNYDKVIEYANVALGANPAGVMRDWSAINNAPSNWNVKTNMYVAVKEPANLLLGTANSSVAYWVGPYSLGKRYGHAIDIFEEETVRANGLWGGALSLYMANSVWGFEQKQVVSKMAGYFEYTDKVAGIGYRQIVTVLFSTNEALLCRAEAYALKNDLASAVTDINIWLASMTSNNTQKTQQEIIDYYKAIDYMPLDNSTRTIKKKINPVGFTVADGDQENIIQCILHLRRVENVHEGLRWQDIKRYGIEISHNIDNQENDILTLNDPRRAMQLPQDVIVAGLKANPRN